VLLKSEVRQFVLQKNCNNAVGQRLACLMLFSDVTYERTYFFPKIKYRY